jgi:glutathione S-transferase
MLDNGFPVYESSIIATYLDSKYNQGKLQQRQDPQLASLVQLASAKLEVGAFYRLLKNQDASSQSEREAEVKESLSAVEQIYRENARVFRAKGPYLLGDALSMAEINIMPFLFRFEILLKHYRQYELLKDFPLLTAALAASKARPAFEATSTDGQVYIDGYAKFANPSA